MLELPSVALHGTTARILHLQNNDICNNMLLGANIKPGIFATLGKQMDLIVLYQRLSEEAWILLAAEGAEVNTVEARFGASE